MASSSPSPYRLGSALSVLYLAYRAGTANLAPLTDCDEVYNYWEPLHFVLRGTGMQTWEYAPEHALRTYAYLLPTAGAASILRTVLDYVPSSLVRGLNALLLGTTDAPIPPDLRGGDDGPLLFACLRSFLSASSCLSDLAFLDAIRDVVDPDVALWTAFAGLFAAGNFHSHPAHLPSATIATLWKFSAARQLRGDHRRAIAWGLVAVLAAGWPFCAALFVPTGLIAMWDAGMGDYVDSWGKDRGNKRSSGARWASVGRLLLRTATHALIIQSIVMAIDCRCYGRIVSPTWNIFAYNARSGGDELYGVEPLSYYVKNLLLNFNAVAVLGLASLPVVLLRRIGGRWVPFHRDDVAKFLPLVPMYLWTAAVFPRPHKEERFLFPMYPMLCLGAAVTVKEVLDLAAKALPSWRLGGRKRTMEKRKSRSLWGLALLLPPAAVSVGRSMALSDHYSAPVHVYRELFYLASAKDAARDATASSDEAVYVCTAGEWHRFPSSFFLPPNHRLGFLKSSFGGQLPQPFTPFGSKEASVGARAGRFNDENREEPDRYVDVERCSYVVELVPPGGGGSGAVPEGLRYMKSDSSASSWTRLASRKYLDAESTPFLHRVLYVPLGRDDKVAYGEYNLYGRDS
ncbi:hypothetical protein ACHAWF_016271 [Thalassiosira exigua]